MCFIVGRWCLSSVYSQWRKWIYPPCACIQWAIWTPSSITLETKWPAWSFTHCQSIKLVKLNWFLYSWWHEFGLPKLTCASLLEAMPIFCVEPVKRVNISPVCMHTVSNWDTIYHSRDKMTCIIMTHCQSIKLVKLNWFPSGIMCLFYGDIRKAMRHSHPWIERKNSLKTSSSWRMENGGRRLQHQLYANVKPNHGRNQRYYPSIRTFRTSMPCPRTKLCLNICQNRHDVFYCWEVMPIFCVQPVKEVNISPMCMHTVSNLDTIYHSWDKMIWIWIWISCPPPPPVKIGF